MLYIFIHEIHAVPQILALMVDLEEEDMVEWANSEDDDDDEVDSNPIAGENAIDRLACALGGPTILPHILATVPPMLQNRKLIQPYTEIKT